MRVSISLNLLSRPSWCLSKTMPSLSFTVVRCFFLLQDQFSFRLFRLGGDSNTASSSSSSRMSINVNVDGVDSTILDREFSESIYHKICQTTHPCLQNIESHRPFHLKYLALWNRCPFDNSPSISQIYTCIVRYCKIEIDLKNKIECKHL